MHHDDYNAHNTMTALRARRLTRNDEFIPTMRAKLGDLQDKRRAKRSLSILAVCAGIVALLALVAVGKLSLQDELQQRDHYCAMVKQGFWPDFLHIAKTECRAHGK